MAGWVNPKTVSSDGGGQFWPLRVGIWSIPFFASPQQMSLKFTSSGSVPRRKEFVLSSSTLSSSFSTRGANTFPMALLSTQNYRPRPNFPGLTIPCQVMGPRHGEKKLRERRRDMNAVPELRDFPPNDASSLRSIRRFQFAGVD